MSVQAEPRPEPDALGGFWTLTSTEAKVKSRINFSPKIDRLVATKSIGLVFGLHRLAEN